MVFTKKEALSSVGPGWSGLIDKFYRAIVILDNGIDDPINPIRVVGVGYRAGMLSLQAEHVDPFIQELLGRLAWSLERDSAEMCEICGKLGYRRKYLPEMTCLCEEHLIPLLNHLDSRNPGHVFQRFGDQDSTGSTGSSGGASR